MVAMIVEDGTAKDNANSYCSVDDANTYHEKRLHTDDWDNAITSTKEMALMWATRLLDDLIDWDGWKYTTTQALRWPRTGVVDLDGDDIDHTQIPDFLKNATAEFARCLIAEDRTADPDTKGFKRIVVGSGDVDIAVDKYDRKRTIPPSVWLMVRHYGKKVKNPIRALVLM